MALTQSDAAGTNTAGQDYNKSALLYYYSNVNQDINRIPDSVLKQLGYTRAQAVQIINSSGKQINNTIPMYGQLQSQVPAGRKPISVPAWMKNLNIFGSALLPGGRGDTPLNLPPRPSMQDSDKANRVPFTGSGGGYFGDTGRGLDSWDRNNSGGFISDPGPSVDFGNLGTPANIPLPSLAAPPPPPPTFNFKVNDFSGQANKMAANAYSPQFQAIQLAKDNVLKNYQANQEIIKGLYAGLADTIATNKQDVADRYAAAQSNADQRYSDLGQSIGNTYSNSQNQMADLLTKLGAGSEAAASVLPQGAGDQAFYQNQAAQQGASQQDFLSNTGNAAQDFQNATSNAAATQGVFSQQDLMRTKDNALSNWDVQRLNLAGNQSQQALSLAQQMADRDMQLQQLNYGVGQDAYKNALAGRQMSNDEAMQLYNARTGQQQNAWGQQMDQANLLLKKLGLDQDYEINKAQLAAQQAGNQVVDPNNPFNKWDAQMGQLFGGNVGMIGNVKSVISGFVNKRGGNLQTYGGDGFRFADDVAKDAAATGVVDPEAARQAAIMYWNTIYSDVAPRMN